MHNKPTIGVFITSTQNDYETMLYKGIHDVVRAAGAHLLCFTSGALRAYQGFEFQRNVLFDLVSHDNVDGLIISGTLSHPVSKEEMAAFLARYPDIPKVSIAMAVPGIPNVMVDNQRGIRDIVSHLVQAHGYRRIGFLRGPKGQEEADERYHAYLEMMAAHGLAPDPDMVLVGDYSQRSGTTAMQAYLTQHEMKLDALVSANDTMAIGAGEVLYKAGYRIPQDIAITGFDDIAAGRFSPCPLTTVRQNIVEQGRLAAQILLNLIEGYPAPEQIISSAVMVLRQSCGCTVYNPSPAPIKHTHTIQPGAATSPAPGIAQILNNHQEALTGAVQENLKYIPADQTSHWGTAWLTGMINALETGDPQRFIQMVETAQQDAKDLGIDVPAWQRTIAAYMDTVRGCLDQTGTGIPPEFLNQMETQAMLHVGALAERIESRRQVELDDDILAIREINEMMSTTFEMSEVLDILVVELPRFHIRSFYLALYDNPQKPAELARMIFAWREGERVQLPKGGGIFPTKNLMPQRLASALKSTGIFIEALYSREDQLGFLILETEPRFASVCNGLRALLSGALQGVLLLEQRREAESKLLETQSQLKALVSQLEMTNKELEAFSYSVSHDLRAPLRAIIGFSSLLAQEHGDALDEEAQHLIQRIVDNSQRMRWLIEELLTLSRVGRQEINMERVDMNALVREVIAELIEQHPDRQIKWVTGELPSCYADAILFRQVWTNLIGNAVKYTAKRSAARIEVGCTKEKLPGSVVAARQNVYFVKDNGVGFDMQYAGKLFGVFQRLHTEAEYPGIGIGLAIAYRIITRHKGIIWVTAQPGEGALFCFTVASTG